MQMLFHICLFLFMSDYLQVINLGKEKPRCHALVPLNKENIKLLVIFIPWVHDMTAQ